MQRKILEFQFTVVLQIEITKCKCKNTAQFHKNLVIKNSCNKVSIKAKYQNDCTEK